MLISSALALQTPVVSGEKRIPKTIINHLSKPLSFQEIKKQLQEIIKEKQHAFIIFKSANGSVSGVCGKPKITENQSQGKLKIR